MPADLTLTEHRPYPLPTRRPAMQMKWHDLLFAHWPIPADTLQNLIPRRLTIDQFEGQAWLGIVPFTMTGVRVRPFPGMPGASLFPEINVRTYVTEGGKPGVYFFSLDAASLLAVTAARTWYHLPYYHARITSDVEGDTITYESSRYIKSGQTPVRFEGSYRAAGPSSCGGCGPLAHWLTERYCLYSMSGRGRIYRADIHHCMWPLQTAEVEIRTNSMLEPLGIILPTVPPLLHFAKRLDVVAWQPVRID